MTRQELEDKKDRRRQQLIDDMQGFWNYSDEDSDESSFWNESSNRGTIDVKAKAKIVADGEPLLQV